MSEKAAPPDSGPEAGGGLQLNGTAGDQEREARDLDQRIDQAIGDVFELLAQAYRTGAWVTLGFPSWSDYLANKADIGRRRIPMAERAEIFGQLRDAGMSQREIAATTGVSQKTVSRSLSESNDSDDDLGGNVVQLRPVLSATEPKPAPPPASRKSKAPVPKREWEMTPEERAIHERHEQQRRRVLQLIGVAEEVLDEVVYKLPRGKFWTAEQRAEIGGRVNAIDLLIGELVDRFPRLNLDAES